MSTGWDHIEKNAVKFPEKLQDDEYRDTLKTVFTNDGKLHFFGEKGVDPTNPNWHETTLVGSFLSTYDLTNKKWLPLKNIAPFDKIDKGERLGLATGLDQIIGEYFQSACSSLGHWFQNSIKISLKTTYLFTNEKFSKK
uniref:Uncharacterized protein n=1 Tax=Romanomermis culicivorax TaxID=13658 RepID=A0A915JK01_ROMCU